MGVAVKAEVLTPQQNELTPTGEGLTPRQKKFCDEYLLDYNGTRAYKVAYGEECDVAAAAHSSRLVRTGKVQEYLQHHHDSRQIYYQKLRERVLTELSYLAFSNIFDYMEIVTDKRGKQVVQAADLTTLTPEQRAAIQSIRVSARGDITVVLCDKLKAIELIGRHLGMFVDRTLVSGDLQIMFANYPQPASRVDDGHVVDG
ncbi:MAG: hypothetical protein DDT19_02324 [Syntrophomonadaceae bacterium]|nr:hypothetical protein [Bacillota bacterium]